MVAENTPFRQPGTPTPIQEAAGLGRPAPQAVADKPTMYPQDVVWNASRREVPPNMSKERFLAGFAKFLKDTNSKLLQIGNTVLVLKSIGPGQAEIDLYTVEPINVLPARFKAGAKAAKEMGYKHIVAFVDSDALMQMVPKLGLNLKVSQGTKVIQGQPVQMPRVDVTL